MNNNFEKGYLYYDREGYEDILRTIDELKAKLRQNDFHRHEAYEAGNGVVRKDSSFDSSEFELLVQKEEMIMGLIDDKYKMLSRAQIIEKHNQEDYIDIGDILEVDMAYPNNEIEEYTFKLVGGDGNFDKEMNEISINSPLGKSVYKKQVGDMCIYSVENKNISVYIKNKLNTKEKNKVFVK